MAKKRTKPIPILYKVKSIYNNDTYYTSKEFPEKSINGEVFKGVKKSPSDNTLHFMLKSNLVIVSNE